MPQETGKKYGPYEIQGRLGGGGMGAVFLAWDARLHREVAIKLLHNEYSMPGMRERFLREARAASALNHPNICTIFDIGEQNGEPYLVMELLQGETLKDRIQHGAIPADEIVLIAREIGEALEAAHAKGVIHRDIKPANIFLVSKPNGGVQVKVLDFGLAKIEGGVLGARTPRSLDITSPGATVGTLAYMSPEQARGEVLDSRSDLFSLGVVLYEMATRQIPFQGATSALIFVQLLNHPPEPVRSWNENIPRDLEKIILKLMAKERTARFQTAHELDLALARLSEKNGGGWLRKAVSNGRAAPDPVARDKRSPKRRDSDPAPERESPAANRIAGVAELTPRPPSDPAQFLRPVARIPRPDATPAPTVDSEAITVAPAEATYTPPGMPRDYGPAPVPDAVPVASEVAVEPENTDSGNFLSSFGEEDPDGPRRRSGLPMGLTAGRLGGAIIFFLVVIAAVVVYHRGRFGPAVLAAQDAVVLEEIDNRTGDKSLDETVAEGLQVDLAQSRYLRLVSRPDYRAVRHLMGMDTTSPLNEIAMQKIAQRFNSKAYLSGTLSGSTSPYLLHVDLHDANTSDVLTSAEERVPSLQQISDSIDRLAGALRFDVGEDRDSITKTSTPLNHEASGNMEALHFYCEGEDAFAAGKMIEAVHLYQQATVLDPRLVEAQLRLTVLYRKLRSELGAANASKLAVAAAGGSSERTRLMAQYEYEMNGTGDYAKAATIIRQVVSKYPHDSQALESLARTLRLEGRFTESLQTAQKAYAEDPYNVDAYTQAENSLIGLDRFDAASQLHTQVEKLGLAHPGGGLIPAYLEERRDKIEAAIAAVGTENGSFRPDWNLGLYYDNIGQFNAGAAIWRSRSASAMKIPGLESAAAFLLAQGALDRAMVGDCKGGLAMAGESGATQQGIGAIFNVAMAYALCGDSAKAQALSDQLQQDYPQSFAVRGFDIADIEAAIALHDLDPQKALNVLKPARQYDLISLTPYLRGRAHVLQQADIQVGIVDFQTVLSHRGVPFIVGSVVCPVAEMGVARAFADTGDMNNSAQAYRHLLALWKDADPNQPLITEAKAHAN